MCARTSLRWRGERWMALFVALALAVCARSARVARAAPIYAFDNLAPAHHGTIGDRLIRFDSTNPVATMQLIGPTLIEGQGISGLDFGDDGVLYATTGFANGASAFSGSRLYTINTNTGKATLVGASGLALGEAISDLSWNPAQEAMQAISYDGTQNRLHTIDLATGAATPVGVITGLPTGAALVGLATDSAGVNYVHDVTSDRMYRLEGTSATALSAPVGFNTNFSQGMVINWADGGAWYLGAPGPGLSSNGLFQINPNTGAATTLAIWPTHDGTIGLPEWQTGDLAMVPEPAGAIALIALLFVVRRNRRHV